MTTQPCSLPPVLWIGGAQWAGKTTVARYLTMRYPLISYSYDYHDVFAHSARARAHPEQYPHTYNFIAALDHDVDAVWVRPSPREMADTSRRIWVEKSRMVLDDLAARPIPSAPSATVSSATVCWRSTW